jgi:predicted DNA-binding ribbon-helix-helix protein
MTASHDDDLSSVSDDDLPPQKGARKRSLTVRGKPTSIFIADDMWREFQALAAEQKMAANRLVSIIRSQSKGSLGQAIRMYVITNRVGRGDG